MRTKTYGKTSTCGVPREEILLAMALQNAKARGLTFTAHAAYVGADGVSDQKNAIACCALGALWLQGVEMGVHPLPYIHRGNDDPDGNACGPGPDIGRAFRDAMT